MTPEEKAVIEAAKAWHDLRLGIEPTLQPGVSYTAESYVNVALHRAVDHLNAAEARSKKSRDPAA